MRRLRAGALLLLGVLVLTAGSGTSKNYAYVTTTGAILGTGTGLLGKGRSVLSIAEVVAGTTPSLFYVKSRDIGTSGTSTADTIPVGNGIAINDFYPDGVDSLACISLGGGAQFIVATDNKP